jgi:hypothetical protein
MSNGWNRSEVIWMIQLRVRVMKLHANRFMVRYSWVHWYTFDALIHREYFDTESDAAAFVSNLVTKTRWED